MAIRIIGVHLSAIVYYIEVSELQKYLQISHWRLMYRIYHGEFCAVGCHFTKIAIYMYTIPVRSATIIWHLCRANLGRDGLKCVGASVWSSILSVNINPNASEFIFSRNLIVSNV